MEDVVIVGAGIAGLATSLGLHRLGIKSLVLESADALRSEGFGFATWTNAWRALDALGVAESLRANHIQHLGIVTSSAITGHQISQLSFSSMDLPKDHDFRCVNRKVLMEIMESELPEGTIRYSSKVVHIQDTEFIKYVHLADGTIINAKVLIGCDGINSVVAKILGFSRPCFTGRSAIRGFVDFEDGHGFEAKSMHFSGDGVKYGILPCDDHALYWFFSFDTSLNELKIEQGSAKMKEYILSKVGNVSNEVRAVFEKTDLNHMICSPLRLRNPLEFMYRNISKDNVCIAGDALHPMTPDMGQGACSALEDSVVLARVLAEALTGTEGVKDYKNDIRRIRKGLEKFARERKWRSFDLVSTSYVVGFIQQSDGAVMKFLRKMVLGKYLSVIKLKKANFDCGKLTSS